MQTRDLPAELLLPPKRLGNLLADARVGGGYSLTEAADALGPTWNPVTLLEVETGLRPVMDPDIKSLTELYGIETTTLIPERSHLVVDLTEGTLGAGGEIVRFESDVVERREVLAQYLAMVYSMRDIKPGLAVPLREPDMEILQGVLGAPKADIESELRALMVSTNAGVGRRVDKLRGRLLIPVIGVVVAVTAVGTLLLVSNDSDAAVVNSTGAAQTTAVPGDSDVSASVGAETEIGEAVVQERLPDGTPGPVTPRN